MEASDPITVNSQIYRWGLGTNAGSISSGPGASVRSPLISLGMVDPGMAGHVGIYEPWLSLPLRQAQPSVWLRPSAYLYGIISVNNDQGPGPWDSVEQNGISAPRKVMDGG